MKIKSFVIHELFGIFNHRIVLKDGGLTIILGPNGFGKTTLLKLIRDFFSGTFAEFDLVPFTLFEINFDDGRSVILTKGDAKTLLKQPNHLCTIALVSPGQEVISHNLDIESFQGFLTKRMREIAPYMIMLGENLWEDSRDGELLDSEEVALRFSIKGNAIDKEKLPDWLREIINSVGVRLIETQRLTKSGAISRQRMRPSRANRPVSDTVTDYANQLAKKIQLRFNDYATLSQQLDRTFVVRLLTHDFAPDQPLTSSSLEDRIEQLNAKRKRLRESGLLSQEEEPLPAPTGSNYTIDQILSAYLQDVENKLAVFDDLLEKLELLKEIVDGRLEFKKMIFSRLRGFEFRPTYASTRISPASLSSGEQHIIILIYDLLFNEKDNSLILIDEPEISLHVDWQLSFLSDLKKIGEIVPRNILLATHSPQIINNNWELAVELARPDGLESI